MKRTFRFFVWKENRWISRADAKSKAGEVLSSEHAEGLLAYSARQAALCRGLRDSFSQKWSGVQAMIKNARLESKDPEILRKRQECDRQRLLKKQADLALKPATKKGRKRPSKLKMSTATTSMEADG